MIIELLCMILKSWYEYSNEGIRVWVLHVFLREREINGDKLDRELERELKGFTPSLRDFIQLYLANSGFL